MNATFDPPLCKIEYLPVFPAATMGLLRSEHSMCRSPFDPRDARAKRETLSSIPFVPASSHLPAYFATRSVTERTLDGKNGALSPHLLVRCRYSTVGQCEHKVMSSTTRSMHSLLSSVISALSSLRTNKQFASVVHSRTTIVPFWNQKETEFQCAISRFCADMNEFLHIS